MVTIIARVYILEFVCSKNKSNKLTQKEKKINLIAYGRKVFFNEYYFDTKTISIELIPNKKGYHVKVKYHKRAIIWDSQKIKRGRRNEIILH